jgi:ubiquinone/menaquinone biosynthesis C-methylase UbiE
VLTKIFLFLIGLSPVVKHTLWRWWYQFLANYYQQPDWRFMNYGFAPLEPDASELKLAEEDENDRYFIQLYHHVATAVDLKGKQVLEVGSGRGGGAAYVARYLKPDRMIGIDFSDNNIQLSRKNYQLPNLSYQQGNAEALPFDNEVFDVLLNVESSHCYGSMEDFVKEVNRVLKPGGVFSWADFRAVDEVVAIQQIFEHSGLKPIKVNEITPNVLRALELMDESRRNFIQTNSPPLLKGALQEFAAVKDSKVYESFQTGEILYLSYVFEK